MPMGKMTLSAPRFQKAIASAVQQRISSNLETKQRSISWDEVAVDAAGGAPINWALTDIDQGDSQADRTGNQVWVTGYFARLAFAVGDTTNLIRVVVYIPKDSDDSLSSGTDIHTNIDLDKFTVLYDKLVALNANGDAVKVIQFKKKFNRGRRRGVNARYFSGTGTDIAKNAIKLYVVSDSLAAPDPTISGGMRVYYKDA